MYSSPRVRPGKAVVALALAAVCTGCSSSENRATTVLAEAIDRYGGELFNDSDIRFEFRGTPFEVLRDGGRFRYQRVLADSAGRTATEVMENAGTWIERNGSRVELDSAETYRVETDVNSVVYFGFLPFRLDDPAVVAEYLGETEIGGEPYHEIRVTFPPEGGGVDWDTQFVYWIHRDAMTVDYLAYRYTRDGGGTRFRRAVNRREIGGLLVQDYENYAASEDIPALDEYDRLYEEGALEQVSMIELENVRVERADSTPSVEGPNAGARLPTDPAVATESDSLEGIEILAGIDRASYGPGDPIEVGIEVVNRASDRQTLEFSSAMRYDIALTDAGGVELFRWSNERAFAQALGEVSLEPGEAVRYEETVPAPETTGSYELVALVPTRPEPLRITLPIEVE